MSKIIEVRSTPFMKNDLTNYIREDSMSNFICPTCGFTNIDCGKAGYKTAREIELEKKLEFAIKALKNLSEETLLTEGGGRFVNSSASIAQKALKEVKE